jgi:hypothetical protein
LPIQLPGKAMLLSGHDMVLEAGYTPLLIGQSRRQSHLLEIYVVSAQPAAAGVGSSVPTKIPGIYELSDVERLVLTALAQRYLRQERHPQPVSWKQVADDLNRVSDGKKWNSKIAANVVSAVRDRLSKGQDPIAGITKDDGIGEPVGNALNHNLIQALLASTTLMPLDLRLLGADAE